MKTAILAQQRERVSGDNDSPFSTCSFSTELSYFCLLGSTMAMRPLCSLPLAPCNELGQSCSLHLPLQKVSSERDNSSRPKVGALGQWQTPAARHQPYPASSDWVWCYIHVIPTETGVSCFWHNDSEMLEEEEENRLLPALMVLAMNPVTRTGLRKPAKPNRSAS